jgi:hypothetical protein
MLIRLAASPGFAGHAKRLNRTFLGLASSRIQGERLVHGRLHRAAEHRPATGHVDPGADGVIGRGHQRVLLPGVPDRVVALTLPEHLSLVRHTVDEVASFAAMA